MHKSSKLVNDVSHSFDSWFDIGLFLRLIPETYCESLLESGMASSDHCYSPQKVLPYTGFPRVVENPGKSWIFITKISRTWKILENEFGTGKSWKLNSEVLEFTCGSY